MGYNLEDVVMISRMSPISGYELTCDISQTDISASSYMNVYLNCNYSKKQVTYENAIIAFISNLELVSTFLWQFS